MPKKPLSQERYVDACGDACPNCGSANQSADPEWNADAGVVSRKVWCNKCDSSWVEFFNLAGYDSLAVPPKSRG